MSSNNEKCRILKEDLEKTLRWIIREIEDEDLKVELINSLMKTREILIDK